MVSRSTCPRVGRTVRAGSCRKKAGCEPFRARAAVAARRPRRRPRCRPAPLRRRRARPPPAPRRRPRAPARAGAPPPAGSRRGTRPDNHGEEPMTAAQFSPQRPAAPRRPVHRARAIAIRPLRRADRPRRLPEWRHRGHRSIRILDLGCGNGDRLLRAAGAARALGFVAIEGRGVSLWPGGIRHARQQAEVAAHPSTSLAFEDRRAHRRAPHRSMTAPPT